MISSRIVTMNRMGGNAASKSELISSRKFSFDCFNVPQFRRKKIRAQKKRGKMGGKNVAG
jgi:hypothetical protein